jgi:glycosyltransferase involved in cell wall biosynthesis
VTDRTSSSGRLTDLLGDERQPPGVRALIDLRPLQEPERMPVTATYLERLLEAYAATPVAGASVIPILRPRRPDPSERLADMGLVVAGRRWLPPTGRVLRTVGLAVDAVALRVAEVRAEAGAELIESRGTLLHTCGGATPIVTRLPMVVTLLDLAPWELPERYARTMAARLARRVRERTLRQAARVLVASRATAESAQRLLELEPERVGIVPLAPDPVFQRPVSPDATARLRAAYAIPERYLVVGGRYDARSDLPTLLAALAALRVEAPAEGLAEWPPVIVLVGAAGTEGGLSTVARLAERHGVLDLVRLTPELERADVAALEASAVAHIQPARSDAVGLATLDALAAGVPVIASRSGLLPELVGPAGIIVEPRDPGRMASAIRTLWNGGSVARQITHQARTRSATWSRSWADVARETRGTYATVVAEHDRGPDAARPSDAAIG